MAEETTNITLNNVLLGDTVAEVVEKINAGISQVNANSTSVKNLTEAVDNLEDSVANAGKVDDVQINGTSIVAEKIANIQFIGADGIDVTPDDTGKVTISAPTIADRFETLNNTLFGENGSSAVKEASKVTNKLKILTEEDTYTEYDGSAEKEIDSVHKANKVANRLKLYTSEIGYSSYDGSKEVSIDTIARATGDYNGDAIHTTYVKIAKIGAAEGVASLDENGKVPSTQLPSYVDDVLEYGSQSAFPETGETGKIYLAIDTNKQYRWSGSQYAEISSSLALGETSSTAYAGDKGKANADAIKAIQDNYVARKAASGVLVENGIVLGAGTNSNGINQIRGTTYKIKTTNNVTNTNLGSNNSDTASDEVILTGAVVYSLAQAQFRKFIVNSYHFNVVEDDNYKTYTAKSASIQYGYPLSLVNAEGKPLVAELYMNSNNYAVIVVDKSKDLFANSTYVYVRFLEA